MQIKALSLILMILLSGEILAQSITLDPSKSSTISTSRSTNYLDINKTGTTNFSGLRFLQNAAVQGGLYFNEDYNYFNLGNGPGTAGLVWNRGTQRVGIGTLTPTGKLQVVAANSASNPHILIQETANNVGARISFENSNVADKKWTLFAKTENSILSSNHVFNIFHTDFGNIAQFYGNGVSKLNGNVEIDGETRMNGYTKLGSDAPKIKTKKFTGSIPDNDFHSVDIDIPIVKIISYDVVIQGSYFDGTFGEFGHWYHGFFKPGGGNPAGCNYNAHIGGLHQFDAIVNQLNTNFYFNDIGNELRKQFTNPKYIIYITYEE